MRNLLNALENMNPVWKLSLGTVFLMLAAVAGFVAR